MNVHIKKAMLAMLVSLLLVPVSFGRKQVNKPALQDPSSPIRVEMVPLGTQVLHPGALDAPVLSVSINARQSDLLVNRIVLDVGDNPAKFTAGFKLVQLVDSDGAILSSVEVDAGSLVTTGSRTAIVFTGFSYPIPQGAEKTLSVRVEVKSSAAQGSGVFIHPFKIAAHGIECADLAGTRLSGPSPVGLTQSVIVTRKG